MRGSAIAGASERPSAQRRLIRSLAAKLIFLLAVFAAAPVIVYQNFEAADRDPSLIRDGAGFLPASSVCGANHNWRVGNGFPGS